MCTDNSPGSRLRGFTLIELLVALAVMAMLAVLSWRSIDSMQRAQSLTQQRADGLLRLQAAMGQWKADLDAITDTEELPPLSFDGSVLKMTRRDAADGGVHSEGVHVVAWTRLQRSDTPAPAWVRWQSGPITQRAELAQAWQRASEWAASGVSAKAPDARDSAVVLAAIDQWQLLYFRGETWSNPQSSVGNESPGSGALRAGLVPDAVRLTLTLSPGAGVSGTISSDWLKPTLVTRRNNS